MKPSIISALIGKPRMPIKSSSAIKIPATPSANKGFSLVEAVIALTIFLFTLAVIGYLMLSTTLTNTLARQLTAATFLGQNQIEVLKGTAYASLANGSDGPLSETGASTGTGLVFTRTWTVVANPGPPTGTSTVTVVVSWTGKSAHQVSFSTILHQ
jgi:type II secretory pathway pseudopilin PulG